MTTTTTTERRKLGLDGPEVFPIALGCMGMSGMYGAADDGESIATIHAAIDAGVNLLDTGDFYGMGHNEMLVGRALRFVAGPGAALGQVRRPARTGRRVARLRRPPRRRENRAGLLAQAARGRTTSTSTVPLGLTLRFPSRRPSGPSRR